MNTCFQTYALLAVIRMLDPFAQPVTDTAFDNPVTNNQWSCSQDKKGVITCVGAPDVLIVDRKGQVSWRQVNKRGKTIKLRKVICPVQELK